MEAKRFPEIQLTASERAFYNGLASAALRKAVTEYTKFNGFVDTANWGYVRRRKQVTMYRSLQPRTDTSVVVGTGRIPGTLEEVMDGLYCDTTADIRCVKTLLDYKLVDGAVLNVTEKREPSAPFRFAGIKWFAAKATWGMTSTRDVLAYERMGTIVDKHGTEVAYHVVQSIDRPEWPANTVKGMKREETSTCYLYRRDRSGGTVKCFLWGEIYGLTSLTQRVAEYVIAGVWLNAAESVKCARAKKCSGLIAQCSGSYVPASNTCHVCYKNQSFMSSSHVACAGCRQNTCKSCSVEHAIFKLDKKSGGARESRFCKLCMNRVRSLSSPETSPDMRRGRWDSAPASLVSTVTPVEFPTPQLHKISRKISYDLLETDCRATPSQSVSTQSSSLDESVLSVHRSASDAGYTESLSGARVHQHYHLSLWSANSYDSDSSSSSVDSDRKNHKPVDDLDDLALRRTEGLGEFDLDLEALSLDDDDDDCELDADLRPTVQLDLHTNHVNGPGSGRDRLNRTHHELIFSSSRRRVAREKEHFLSDLYASPPPSYSARRQRA